MTAAGRATPSSQSSASQAPAFSFIVVATQVGTEVGLITSETSTALVGAGLLSMVIFPAAAMSLIGRDRMETGSGQAPASSSLRAEEVKASRAES